MPLQLPNLDDRSFDDLRNEAIEEIQKYLGSDWNDLSVSDPGIVLLEAFTYLTEQLIYRLNQLPEKVYIAFLRLLGVLQRPPSAAQLELVIQLDAAVPEEELDNGRLLLERGTRLQAERQNSNRPLQFVLEQDLYVTHSPQTVTVRHLTTVAAEQIGPSNGRPGQSFALKHPPIVAQMGNDFDVIVAVELDSRERRTLDLTQIERVEEAELLTFRIPLGDTQKQAAPPLFRMTNEADEERVYRLWREVENFSHLRGQNSFIYTVDRLDGLIHFAPMTRFTDQLRGKQLHQQRPPRLVGLEAVPPKGSDIRVWYPQGGGEGGNALPGTPLTLHEGDIERIVRSRRFPSAVPFRTLNIKVQKLTKPGAEAERLEDALIRGPRELFALQRAITTQEIEATALAGREKRLLRAKAYTQKERWQHAQPGTIGLTLVPNPEHAKNLLPTTPEKPQELLDQLIHARDEGMVKEIDDLLAQKIPLGIQKQLQWARLKPLSLTAHLVLERDAGRGQTEEALRQATATWLSPRTWPFGRALRIKELASFLGRQPNVREVQTLTVTVADAPHQGITSIASDQHQPQCWYVTSQHQLYRSLNDGHGWEVILSLDEGSLENGRNEEKAADNGQKAAAPGEERRFTKAISSPYQAGVVASISLHRSQNDTAWSSHLYITRDCWETTLDALGTHTDLKAFHFKIEDAAWLERGDESYLLLATDRGLYEVMVFDEQGRFVFNDRFPELIPILEGRQEYPLYAVQVIDAGKSGSAKVAVALKSQRGVYISKSPFLRQERLQQDVRSRASTLRSDLEKLLGRKVPQHIWEELVRNQNDAASPLQLNAERLLGQQLSPETWQELISVEAVGESRLAHNPDIWDEVVALAGEDVRQLYVHHFRQEHIYLWACARAKADKGKGCYRIRFDHNAHNRQAGRWLDSPNWTGGSCYGVAFLDDQVFAATTYRGVATMRVNPDNPDQERWQYVTPQQLPLLPLPTRETDLADRLRTERLFQPLLAIGSNNSNRWKERSHTRPLLLVGGRQGLYRSHDRGDSYHPIGRLTIEKQQERVTLPPDWLFVLTDANFTLSRFQEIEQQAAVWEWEVNE